MSDFDQLDRSIEELRIALQPDGIREVNEEPEHLWQVLGTLVQTLGGVQPTRELLADRGFHPGQIDAALAQLEARQSALGR